jgi:hypothetical protein
MRRVVLNLDTEVAHDTKEGPYISNILAGALASYLRDFRSVRVLP